MGDENRETMRDRFAMAALTGLAAHRGTVHWNAEMMARNAYVHADAMLVARRQIDGAMTAERDELLSAIRHWGMTGDEGWLRKILADSNATTAATAAESEAT